MATTTRMIDHHSVWK